MNHCLCVETYWRYLTFNSQLPITWVGPNSPLPFPPRGSINLWWEQQQITLERGEIRLLCFWWFIIHFSNRQPRLISTHLIHTHQSMCSFIGDTGSSGGARPSWTTRQDKDGVSASIFLPGHPLNKAYWNLCFLSASLFVASFLNRTLTKIVWKKDCKDLHVKKYNFTAGM